MNTARILCEQMPNGMMVTGNGMVPMANQNPHMPGMVPIMQSPQMPPVMQGSSDSISAIFRQVLFHLPAN